MSTKFNDYYIKLDDGTKTINRNLYADRMPDKNIKRSSASFMYRSGEAAYVSTCSRPDVTCAANQLYLVMADESKEEKLKRLDKVFQRMRCEISELKSGHVNLDSAEIFVFADAAFKTNRDLASQIGDDDGN